MWSNEMIITLYLEWRNDFLTVECFAEYHGLELNEANWIINNGRILNEGLAMNKKENSK